jgi:hypothetical protein
MANANFNDGIPMENPRSNMDPNYSHMQGSPQDPGDHPSNNLPDGQSFAAQAMESKDIQNSGDLAKRLGSKYKVAKGKGGGGKRKKK